MKIVWISIVCLACFGCASGRQSTISSVKTNGVPEFQLNGWRTPPRVINVPLPDTQLRGAPTLRERNDIYEAVIRHVASQAPTNYYFFGFENNETTAAEGFHKVLFDLNPELVRRLDNLKPHAQPVSLLKLPPEDISDATLEQAYRRQQFMFWFITSLPNDTAQVEATLEVHTPIFANVKTVYRYYLVRSRGKWKVTRQEMRGQLG